MPGVSHRERRSRRTASSSDAIAVVRQHQRASASLLQRKLRIGSTRAARLIDLLAERGFVSEDPGGGRSREVLIQSGPTPSADADEGADLPPWDK